MPAYMETCACACGSTNASSPSIKHLMYFPSLEDDAKKECGEKLLIMKTSHHYVQLGNQAWQKNRRQA